MFSSGVKVISNRTLKRNDCEGLLMCARATKQTFIIIIILKYQIFSKLFFQKRIETARILKKKKQLVFVALE